MGENKPYPYSDPHPKDLLGAFARVVGPGPDVGEVVRPRVLVSLAARVHDDVAVLLRAFHGARDLGGVALVDDHVHLAGLAVGDVRQQLVQLVALAVTRLREDRAMLRGNRAILRGNARCYGIIGRCHMKIGLYYGKTRRVRGKWALLREY